MSKPLLVAITGGIGSGKTTVVNIFKELGVPAYIADHQAKVMMSENKALRNKIKNEFGEESYQNGELNKTFLSKTVFEDNDKLTQLNNIVHPMVRKDFEDWIKAQSHPYLIYESALVFEHNQQDRFDKIILVTAPEKLRIERVKKRSNMSENEIRKRILKQMPDNLKKGNVNYIIENIDKDQLNAIVSDINNKIIQDIIKKS